MKARELMPAAGYILGKSDANPEKMIRTERAELQQLRQREKIQGIPTNMRDHALIEELAKFSVAFYSGLASPCVTVTVIDPGLRVAGAAHYNTMTEHHLVEYMKSSGPTREEKQRFIDEFDVPDTGILVSKESRMQTIVETMTDAADEFALAAGGVDIIHPVMLIAGISYVSAEEADELTQFASGQALQIGIPLVSGKLGSAMGIYAGLNHKFLTGFGFYNHKTRVQLPVGEM